MVTIYDQYAHEALKLVIELAEKTPLPSVSFMKYVNALDYVRRMVR